MREPLPKTDPERFAVAVAHLENDENGELERLIVEDLEEFEGVQVLSVDRTIRLTGAAREQSEKRGHEEARRYLAETGATVLVWGTVVRHENRALPKLYLTTSPRVESHSGRYRPTEDLRLPELSWADLADVLRLVIVSRDAEFAAKQGQYVADQLPPFIAKVRRLLGASEGAAGWDPDARASTLLVFADSLYALGEQRGENAPLEEAVSAYRAALEERTRERVPLDWAGTQSNLGNALQILGEREGETTRLEEAVTVFRAALEERTRERVPLEWATTQNNLGGALLRLGEREIGTARLEEAVGVFRAALEERTRERVPLDWAGTQNNLGNALSTLGERESGTARLEAAVAAYRAALEEFTRERAPLRWAATQNNLGAALRTLGERESGTARLEAAVAAYRAALEERTRERLPLDWAMTQNNLGNALSTLGGRESGTARLEEAVSAFGAALQVFEQARAAYYIEGVKPNLERVQALIRERRAE